ncbi:MAG: M20/M25/M40 family metallo-hydrolase [Defluviitaleaceae bacterium]|nr:M20/M25/M40 family metallo-hydrolase [Defluviitaleaceae bacterium]
MDSLQLIKDLSCAFGPSGFEEDVHAAAQKYIPPGYETSRDHLLNLYIQKPIHDESKPTVLIEAHSDEIGLIVQAVKSNGTMSFLPLGGWIPATLSAQRVCVRNCDGQLISGVIAAKMHHFGGAEEPPLKLDGMVIDIGAKSKEEVVEKYKITPGCPVVPHSVFEQQGDTLIAKAFDDRLGCAAVLEVLDALKASDLSVNLVGAFSSQEEVGIRGAKTVANRVKPDLAICFEGAPADDTLVDGQLVQTAMGKGPMLRHIDGGMITNPRLLRFALDIAARENIPVQEAVRSRGSTNGSWYHVAGLGIPTLVISVPVRYAHSPHSMTAAADYKQCVKLAEAVVKALDNNVIRSL